MFFSREPFLAPGLNLLDTVGNRQILRHRTAKLFDGLSYLATHSEMGGIFGCFTLYTIAPQLLLCLGSAKIICGQLRAAI
jgi:hypothetical protein